MDFPVPAPTKPTLGWYSREGIGAALRNATANTTPANAAYPSANLGYFIPLALDTQFLLKGFWWALGGTNAGNVDAGVYTVGGTLLTSIGPTAMAGTANTPQLATLGSALLLLPGSYYLAMSCSSVTANLRGIAVTGPNLQMLGLAQQASVGTLPATMTPAAFAQASIPLFGITRLATI